MDLTVRTTAYQADGRVWLRGSHGTEPGANPSITLDLTAGGFVAGTHYPNGYIPSGTILGKITTSGKYGVYDSAASDGRQTAAGILFDPETVSTGQTTAVNALFVHGFVDPTRLPFQAGTGSASAAAKTALNLIHWL